jgi:hypothetical protein
MLTDMSAGACVGGVCSICTVDTEGCHYDGWTAMMSNTTADLHALWVGGIGDAFAGGKGGVVLQYNGAGWSQIDFPSVSVNASVIALSGTADTDLFALVDNGQVFHSDGKSWSDVSPPGSFATDLWSPAGNTAIVVEAGGDVETYAAGGWTTAHVGVAFNGVDGASASDIFAVGNTGKIEHFTTAWAPEASTVTQQLNAVWSDGIDAFAVGAAAADKTIVRRTGTWSAVTAPALATVDLFTVWGTSGNDVYVGGAGGTIGHFDGNAWAGTTVSGTVRSIRGRGRVEVFAVSSGGVILRLTP